MCDDKLTMLQDDYKVVLKCREMQKIYFNAILNNACISAPQKKIESKHFVGYTISHQKLRVKMVPTLQ